MQVAICDDDIYIREKLIHIIKGLCDNCSFKEFENGESLIEGYRKGESFALIFLDIYMKELNGMEVAKLIRDVDEHVQIIFFTSSSEFAVESYSVKALSYVLKPFDENAIKDVWEKFKNIYKPRSILLKDRLFVADDIVCVESMDKKIIIRFKDCTFAEITCKLDEAQTQLRGCNFMRCHRSFIVNMDYIKSVGDSEFIMSTGDRVLIRAKQFNQIKREYYGYITSF